MNKPMSLNEEQSEALKIIHEGKSVFLTGPGGTGKSFLIQRIVETLNEKLKKVAVTALTGCAALLLGKEAKTIYSWAGIGLGRDEATKIGNDIRKQPWKVKVLRRWLLTKVLIIDEISMMTPEILELLDTVGRLVRRQDKPFGGLQLILVGDFFQLPPVSKDEARFVFESPIWNTLDLTTITLKQIMRQSDSSFQEILNEARFGKLSAKSLATLKSRQIDTWQTLKIRPTLLFSRRSEVDMINRKNLKALTGQSKTFEAKTVYDTTIAKGKEDTTFALAKLDRDAPYTVSLELKVGTQVMLIYNLDQANGLVNGSRGIIEDFNSIGYPMVLFKGCDKAIEIGPQSWESDEIEGLKRSQIPLILAYAVTIHKCQGATLDSALIDIGCSTFETGQAYVALSRVKSLDSLYIFDLEPEAFKANKKVLAFYT
jgi:ATP-dependent DNA helicase PIF1